MSVFYGFNQEGATGRIRGLKERSELYKSETHYTYPHDMAERIQLFQPHPLLTGVYNEAHSHAISMDKNWQTVLKSSMTFNTAPS